MSSCEMKMTSTLASPMNPRNFRRSQSDVTSFERDSVQFVPGQARNPDEEIPATRDRQLSSAGDRCDVTSVGVTRRRGESVPIPCAPVGHVTGLEWNPDAAWFLDTGSPPCHVGYAPEVLLIQNSSSDRYTASTNQLDASHLLRYGYAPEDTWSRDPYTGSWEPATFWSETARPMRNRSASDAAPRRRSSHRKLKRTVTFAADSGDPDQIFYDTKPWMTESSAENTTFVGPESREVGLTLVNNEGRSKSLTADADGAVLVLEGAKSVRGEVGDSGIFSAKEAFAGGRTMTLDKDSPSTESKILEELAPGIDQPGQATNSRGNLGQGSSRRDSNSPGRDFVQDEADTAVGKSGSHLANESKISGTDIRAQSRKRYFPSSSNDVIDVVDVTANLNVQFRYDETGPPGETIQYGNKITCRVDGRGGMQNATDVISLSKQRVLVTDMLDGRFFVFDQSGETLLTYVIDGVTEPWAATLTSDGVTAVTSRGGKCVTLVNSDGSAKHSFGKDILQSPSGVAYDARSDTILVTDAAANKIFVFSPQGDLVRALGEGQGLKNPSYVSISPQGEIIVSDSGNHCVKVFDEDGVLLRQFGRFGREDGCLRSPQGLCTDSVGNVLVCDHYNDRLSVFSRDGKFVRHLVSSLHGIRHPQGLTLTSDLKLYVTHGRTKATDVTVFDLHHGEFV